ncbi:MAG: DNA repair protein RecN [Clostridiales bacterium]|nr:DNA repair protein RecN [Clostridiales bacterium]
MLHTLKIKNFALIADQTINFEKGFNVLVGETGAGKSLILDALGFALGDKANKLNLRHGEEKLLVQAVFDNDNSQLSAFLEENDIESDDNIIFSRTMNIDGRSECRINGVIVPVGIVKQCANFILDTYAQNENISLLNAKNHLGILDSYAEKNLFDVKKEISELLTNLNGIISQSKVLGGNNENRARELELLEYQINDIQNANLKIGEDDELKAEIEKLNNFEKIFDAVKNAEICLSNINDRINEACSNLEHASRYDSALLECSTRLDSSKLELEDLQQTISEYMSDFDFDQQTLEKLDKRLEEIKLLKKKYGATIQDVLSYLENTKTQYDNLLFGEEKLAKLQKEKEQITHVLYEKCKQLSEIRRSVAIDIEKQLNDELKLLGFKNASFKIGFAEIPSLEDCNFSSNGIDDVEFLLSANAGEGYKSLSKTISGGEMSRFMLAIKNVFARCFNSSTLVFDEVDTGISGEIGQKVAERLALLSKNHQLICITHLCQVTAMADNYIYVKKDVIDNKTFTTVSKLVGNNVIKYIAVVSGAEPTEVAMQFASELKQKADLYKSSI